MWWKLLLALPPFLYAAVLLALYLGQTAMLFPAGMAAGTRPLPRGAERLIVETPDGERLHGVRLKGPGQARGVRSSSASEETPGMQTTSR
jgi:hypothetical protein